MKRGLFALLAVAAVVVVLVFMLKPKPAPVSFEPEQLVFTESGIQTLNVVNESEEGIVLHLDWHINSSYPDARCHSKETVRLIPGEVKKIEVEVHQLQGGARATITPDVDSWQRAMKVPGGQKIDVPSMRRTRAPTYYAHTVVNCYYVNESNRARWVLLNTKLEPKTDDLFTHVEWYEAAHANKPIEPGQARWYEVAIKPAWKVETSGTQTVTLVVDADELLWKPEMLTAAGQEELQKYRT